MMNMLEGYYAMLTGLFSPIINLNSALAELILASMVILMITIIYRILIDQNKAKETKIQLGEIQKKLKEVKDNKEETDKATAEMLKLTNQQMRSNMKPMMVTLIVAFAFLPWMGKAFATSTVSLPFSLPFFGNDFGWLAWYIIVSVPLSMMLRKTLGVVT